MDGIYDLIEMLKSNGVDGEDLLDDLTTLSRIDVIDWQAAIEEEATLQGRCPECFEKLEKQLFTEWYPFGDTMVGQEFAELVCPTHGMI